VWGKGISQNVVWYVVRTCWKRAGLEHIAPHDLRRTCAKLCHDRGGELEQIQFLLGQVLGLPQGLAMRHRLLVPEAHPRSCQRIRVADAPVLCR